MGSLYAACSATRSKGSCERLLSLFDPRRGPRSPTGAVMAFADRNLRPSPVYRSFGIVHRKLAAVPLVLNEEARLGTLAHSSKSTERGPGGLSTWYQTKGSTLDAPPRSGSGPLARSRSRPGRGTYAWPATLPYARRSGKFLAAERTARNGYIRFVAAPCAPFFRSFHDWLCPVFVACGPVI